MISDKPRFAGIDLDVIESLMHVQSDVIAYEFSLAQTGKLSAFDPESKLMFAILQDALNVIRGKITAGTYSNSKKSKESPLLETIEWLESDDVD